jgi:hypothetical protein
MPMSRVNGSGGSLRVAPRMIPIQSCHRDGAPSHLNNVSIVIDLLQGTFHWKLVTFNPGWDSDVAALLHHADLVELHRP